MYRIKLPDENEGIIKTLTEDYDLNLNDLIEYLIKREHEIVYKINNLCIIKQERKMKKAIIITTLKYDILTDLDILTRTYQKDKNNVIAQLIAQKAKEIRGKGLKAKGRKI